MKHCFLNYLYLGVFFMGFSLGVQGQERQVIDDLFEHNKMMTIDLTDKSLQGSMYIEEKLHVASVSGTDALYAMRYNAYYDEMEYEKKGVFYNLPKVFNYTVHFESLNKTYKIYSYPLKGKEEKGFFVLLYSGEKISLLNKEIVKFHEEVKAKSGYDKYIPPKLKRAKDKMYITSKNDAAKPLPKKKKEILALFSNKSKEVEKYAKSNGLGFKKTNDLIALFTYYNGL